MEEDIEKMQDFIMVLRAEPEDNPKAFLEIDYASQKEIAQVIENLINKYKELEKECDEIYADYQDLGKEKLKLEEENQVVRGANNYWVMKFCEANNKNKEQEKVIELMAEAFKQDDVRNKEEIIEYFRNEAKKNEKPEKN